MIIYIYKCVHDIFLKNNINNTGIVYVELNEKFTKHNEHYTFC